MNLAKYDVGSEFRFIDEPSPQQLKEIITLLNNDDCTSLNLHKEVGTLSVFGGNDGRVVVTFRGKGSAKSDAFRTGKLIDPDISDGHSEVEISVNGTITPELLRKTVPKEIAITVVNFYLANDSLPDNLFWQGSMK